MAFIIGIIIYGLWRKLPSFHATSQPCQDAQLYQYNNKQRTKRNQRRRRRRRSGWKCSSSTTQLRTRELWPTFLSLTENNKNKEIPSFSYYEQQSKKRKKNCDHWSDAMRVEPSASKLLWGFITARAGSWIVKNEINNKTKKAPKATTYARWMLFVNL